MGYFNINSYEYAVSAINQFITNKNYVNDILWHMKFGQTIDNPPTADDGDDN